MPHETSSIVHDGSASSNNSSKVQIEKVRFESGNDDHCHPKGKCSIYLAPCGDVTNFRSSQEHSPVASVLSKKRVTMKNTFLAIAFVPMLKQSLVCK